MAANIIKKPGPPVPPRPQHTTSTTTSLIATSLRTAAATNIQNSGSIVTKANNHSQTVTSFMNTNSTIATKSTTTTTTTHNSYINKSNNNITTEQNSNSNNKQNPPIIHKKPIMSRQTSNGAGRTVIYKSPTISMQQRQEQISISASRAAGAGGTIAVAETNATSVSMRNTTGTIMAPKPPLKLRKAPDVPKIQQQQQQQQQNPQITNSQTNGVTLNRHNSMGCTNSPKAPVGLKETRLSLGRADLDKFGKIHLNHLQLSSQPLPKPRKIVQMPVATLDVEDKTTSKTNSMANIFRRSKTSLDNSLNNSGCTGSGNGIGNMSSPNRFLSGKTVEIKNNLKNAAERLFAEIIVSQHNKHAAEPMPTIITKHERAIQHTTTMIPKQQLQQPQLKANTVTVAVNSIPSKVNVINSNCTRICINANSPATQTATTTPTIGKKTFLNGTVTTKMENKKPIESILNSPEKKQAFHEILISELAAMRTKSSSMENLQTKSININNHNNNVEMEKNSTSKMQAVNANARLRCNSVEEFDEDENGELVDHEDADANNTDDIEMDEELLRKKFKLSSKHSTRKRCPSGCSSDSSPYGTERSARIRTSDWVEVQDNGKPVTLTSCHISLEDSGLEDEERLDDISTSGVGDSWDSVKETQNEQRLRNIKR